MPGLLRMAARTAVVAGTAAASCTLTAGGGSNVRQSH
jgi:hypothetical protein